MKWNTKEEVPDAFGPKAYGDLTQTNWAATRYVDWSSWASVASIWPSASGNSSIEGESSGMSTYAHELSHNLSIPDNYGNPYGAQQQRGFTGMWDMMSRGTFNGPGGPHTRFQHPADAGLLARLAAQHPQQAVPELRRRQRPDAAQPQRACAVRPGCRGRHRA